MEVILGKTSGFCGGVIRSVNETDKLISKYGEIYCLGELVHNRQVVESFEKKGVKFIESLDEVEDGANVIVRAHGIPKEIYEIADKRNINLFDLTCPKVSKIHSDAEKYIDDESFIVLIAQKNHPETIGTISFCGQNSMIVENEEDINNLFFGLDKEDYKRIVIFAQTTFSLDKFNMFAKMIKEHFLNKCEVIINNTVCNATELRQNELKELATKVDAMIIIGGKNSSNTKKLYEIADKLCQNSCVIETVDDLKEDYSIYGKVGVMAGASTPKESIDDVLNYLNNL